MTRQMLVLSVLCLGACDGPYVCVGTCGPNDVGRPPEVTSCDVQSGRRATIALGETMPLVYITWTEGVEEVTVAGVTVDLTAEEHITTFRCGEAILVHFNAPRGVVMVSNNNPPAIRPYLSQWVRLGNGWTLHGYGPTLDSNRLAREDDMLIAAVTAQNYWWYDCRGTVSEQNWPNTCDSQVQPPDGYSNGNSGPWHVRGGGFN